MFLPAPFNVLLVLINMYDETLLKLRLRVTEGYNCYYQYAGFAQEMKQGNCNSYAK